jgi:hypothetical protein
VARRQRQRALIKVSEIRRLAKLQVSIREAAGYFRVGVKTFQDILAKDERAAAAWEEGQQEGKISLRRKQFRLADENASMAIWLGKQWLSQQDVVVTEHSGRDGGPIQNEFRLDVSKMTIDERRTVREMVKRIRKDEPGPDPE